MFSNPEKETKTIFLYNLKENKKYEITSFIYDEDVYKSFQMDDDNIIIKGKDTIRVIKIKKKGVEFIQIIDEIGYYSINKLSNKTILLGNFNNIKLYSYNNGKLIDDNHLININCINAYMINENEIGIHTYDKGYFSQYDILIFYDLKNDKQIASLKIGKTKQYSSWCCKTIGNNLIFYYDNKYLIIDTEKRKIIKEGKVELRIWEIISLNEKIFLIRYDEKIEQYEIYNEKKVKYLSSFFIGYCSIYKYPGNRFLLRKNNKIYIYG